MSHPLQELHPLWASEKAFERRISWDQPLPQKKEEMKRCKAWFNQNVRTFFWDTAGLACTVLLQMWATCGSAKSACRSAEKSITSESPKTEAQEQTQYGWGRDLKSLWNCSDLTASSTSNPSKVNFHNLATEQQNGSRSCSAICCKKETVHPKPRLQSFWHQFYALWYSIRKQSSGGLAPSAPWSAAET